MILQVDAGNTRIKWRLRDGVRTVARSSGHHESHDLFGNIGDYGVKRILVSAVTSKAARRSLADRLAALFVCPAEFHESRNVHCGVYSAYDCPHTLGADRWHALIAARASSASGQIVVDAGSALTVDYLAATGQHLGGYILPGRRLMMESLQQKTANVAFENKSGAEMMPGRSTQDCVIFGQSWLCSALGDRLQADARRYQLGRILVTGGDASYLLALGFPGQHYPDLVLDGLEIAAQTGGL